MPLSDPLQILLTHNEWATHHLLQACQPLTPEQFHKKFDIGPGTLHDAITHIISAMRAWCDMLAQRDRRPPLDGTRSVAELTSLFNDAALELRTLALARPLHESVSASRQGITYTFTRGAILTHVTTHGMHHRAQALNMFRQLGLKGPPSAVVEWMRDVDAPPGIPTPTSPSR